MTDTQILTQLLNGHHLEPKELKRANEILYKLKVELHNRNAKQ